MSSVSGSSHGRPPSPWTTTASHGTELCQLCQEARTKKGFRCRGCRDLTLVCEACVTSGRAACNNPHCRLAADPQDIRTDSDLRSGTLASITQPSSSAGSGEPAAGGTLGQRSAPGHPPQHATLISAGNTADLLESLRDARNRAGDMIAIIENSPLADGSVESSLPSAGPAENPDLREPPAPSSPAPASPSTQPSVRTPAAVLHENAQQLARVAPGERQPMDVDSTGTVGHEVEVDDEVDDEVEALVLLLLQDTAEPQDVLEIRRALQNRHNRRQLNRVLHQLVGKGLLSVIPLETGTGKPKYTAGGSSQLPSDSKGAQEDDGLQARILKMLKEQTGPLDTLRVAKEVGLTVQKDVRGALDKLEKDKRVVREPADGQERLRWRLA